MAFTDANQTISVDGASRTYYDINSKDPKLVQGRHRRAALTNGESDFVVSHRTDKGSVARHELKIVDKTQDENNVANQEQVVIAITHENGDVVARDRAVELAKAALAWLVTATYPESLGLGLS